MPPKIAAVNIGFISSTSSRANAATIIRPNPPNIKISNSISFMFNFIFHPSSLSIKIKSAATEVTAQKMQTPIVAKLTQCETDVAILKSMEFAFLSNSQFKYGKISVVSSKENTPNFTSIKLVWHTQFTIPHRKMQEKK